RDKTLPTRRVYLNIGAACDRNSDIGRELQRDKLPENIVSNFIQPIIMPILISMNLTSIHGE
ncbi:hypothetical protein JZM05_25520, partial [Escherichia coli]|uniref:hypothetical protein n=1 Tax=Escherichia coli TaxID=562 RepID=UPI0019D2A80B